MPRMKLTNAEFNEKQLDVKVEPSKFKRYTGDVPKTGTILVHRVTKMWWTQAEDGTSMIKALAVAEDNTGEKKKFNGLPTWEYLVFKPEGAWRYVPFLQCFGITLRDIKNKMVVSDEPDNIGDVIESLGGWEVGSDDALCRIVIQRKKWEGDFQSRVDRDGWLPLEDEDEEDEDVDEDDIEEDDEDEEDEPPARPTRGSRSTSRSAGTRASSRRRAEPEPDDEDEDEDDDDLEDEVDDEDEDAEEAEEEDDEEAEEEPPARPARRTATRSSRTPARAASSSRSASSGRSRPARDGSRAKSSRSSDARTPTSKKRGSTDDPPF